MVHHYKRGYHCQLASFWDYTSNDGNCSAGGGSGVSNYGVFYNGFICSIFSSTLIIGSGWTIEVFDS